MKKSLLCICLGCFIVAANAQSPTYLSAFGYSFTSSKSKLDKDGNIINIGTFTGSVDFDPSPAGTFNLNSIGGALYIQKLDSDGNFLWAKNFGSSLGSNSENVFDISFDSFNNYCITGFFGGTADFDPSGDVTNLVCDGDNSDIFVAKFNENGGFIWAFNIGGTGSANNDYGYGIANDSQDDIIITGSVKNIPSNIDFDPGSSTASNTSGGFFVAKYSSAGAYEWAHVFPGGTNSKGKMIFVYPNDNLLILGTTLDVDFDPSPTGAQILNLTSNGYSTFYLQLNSSGDFVGVKAISGSSNVEVTNAQATSDLSHLICTIDCAGATTDSDPDPSETADLNTHFSNFGKIIQKLDAHLNLVWAKSVKKDYNACYTNGTDNYANIQDTIVKYDASGSVIWKHKVYKAFAHSILINDAETRFTVAGFNGGNANCDPFTNTPSATLGNESGLMYFWELSSATQVVDPENSAAFGVFPNPSSGSFLIKANENGQLRILDATGKLVYEKYLNTDAEQIVLSEFKKGMYFIQLNDSFRKLLVE